jgi:hypothetical protein
VTVALITTSLSLLETKITELLKELPTDKKRVAEAFHLFFGHPLVESFDSLKSNIELLFDVQDIISLTSPYGNFVATTCQAVTFSLGVSVVAKRIFEQQMIMLSSGMIVGPFSDFNAE